MSAGPSMSAQTGAETEGQVQQVSERPEVGKYGEAERDPPVIRGDGTKLPKRDEQTQPRNPKKKTFEEEAPPPQVNEGNKDEL